jgi:Tfp pilus assembly protein PilO
MEEILSRPRWWIVRFAPRAGKIGWTACAVLLACAGALAFSLVPAHYEIARLRNEINQMAAQAPRSDAARVEEESPNRQIARFARLLATSREIPRILATIHRAATANGVVLPEGEFKLIAEQGNPISRYQITFPIKTEYHRTRQFVREALRETPSLALDELSFRRDDANNPVLDTRVRFTLFLAAGDSEPPQ